MTTTTIGYVYYVRFYLHYAVQFYNCLKCKFVKSRTTTTSTKSGRCLFNFRTTHAQKVGQSVQAI